MYLTYLPVGLGSNHIPNALSDILGAMASPSWPLAATPEGCWFWHILCCICHVHGGVLGY